MANVRSWTAEFGTSEGMETSGTVEENFYFELRSTSFASFNRHPIGFSAKFENTISLGKDGSLQFGYLASAASVLDVDGYPVTAAVRQAHAGDHAIQFGAFSQRFRYELRETADLTERFHDLYHSALFETITLKTDTRTEHMARPCTDHLGAPTLFF